MPAVADALRALWGYTGSGWCPLLRRAAMAGGRAEMKKARREGGLFTYDDAAYC